MAYDPFFDTDQNRALMAICARKLISGIGIGGTIWGAINIGGGVVALDETLLNLGLVLLGAVMLGIGLVAVVRPSLNVLLAEGIGAVLLFLWNVGVTMLNYLVAGVVEPTGLILPVIAAMVFISSYVKLHPLRELIATVEPEKVRATKRMCKDLMKKKLKADPTVVKTEDGKTRAQLMPDEVFIIQRDLMRAFTVSKEEFRAAIVKPGAKRMKVRFRHPLGKLTYQFDRRSTAKLNAWLEGAPPDAEPPAAEDLAAEPA